MITHYWDAMMENTVPFLLAWEAYVFFMLIFFISIVYRLARIENFPFWELYVFFIMLLFISIIIRLDRIEKKVNRLLRKRR
mgnify:CR=1 FL=1